MHGQASRSPEDDAHGEPPGPRDPLELSATEFVEQRRSGRLLPIEEYARRAPSAAEDIRDLLPVVNALESLRDRRNHRSGRYLARSIANLQRLGDFRIIRELGKGGMGVVFEAEQESLARRVAIKVLPRLALLDDRRVERFRREAQTAARLHHTNIVPIFGVGQHADYHYYVMQLIPGAGLDEVLVQLRQCVASSADAGRRSDPPQRRGAHPEAAQFARRLLVDRWVKGRQVATSIADGPSPFVLGPAYWYNVARLGAEVADALAYAHQRDTLHRDVKPGNLILDCDGSVWVADFGLAKSLGQDDLSRSGDAQGTLRYMAPERFRGVTDARCDVYSLGLTLYELLTLRPGFRGFDHATLVQQIVAGNFTPPRQLNAAIPRDLETIVLTATAHDPAKRYASASALAEDLHRFLQGRSILARRPSPAERIWRWCRRNKSLALMTTAVAASLVLTTVISIAGWVETRAAYRQAQSAFEAAAQEKERAEGISEVALLTLDNISADLTPDEIDDTRLVIRDVSGDSKVSFVFSEHTAVMLEEMLAHYERMQQRIGNTVSLRERKAEAARRLAYIRFSVGECGAAHAAYEQAVAQYLELLAAYPQREPLAVRAVQCLVELGDVLWLMERHEAARQSYQRGLALAQQALETASESRDLLAARAECQLRLGQRRLLARLPRWLAKCEAAVEEAPSAWGEAALLAEAQAAARRLVAQDAENRRYRRLLGQCLRESAAATPAPVRSAWGEEAIGVFQALVRDYPLVPDYRYDLSLAYANVGPCDADFTDAELQQAWERLRDAEQALDAITRQNPHVLRYVVGMADVYHRRGVHVRRMVQQMRHDGDGLRSHFVRAEATVDSLELRYPEVAAYRLWSIWISRALAEIDLHRGNLDVAAAQLSNARQSANCVPLHDPLAATFNLPRLQRLIAGGVEHLARGSDASWSNQAVVP